MFTRIQGAETGVLPKVFGNDFLMFENMLFDTASRITRYSDEPYNGGKWNFMEDKENGVEFVAMLQDDREFYVYNPGNGTTTRVSTEVFSIVVTNIALNYCLWHWYEQGNERRAGLYDRLWRQVNDIVGYNHDECAKIRECID